MLTANTPAGTRVVITRKIANYMPPVGLEMTLVRWVSGKYSDALNPFCAPARLCTVSDPAFNDGLETMIMARWARRAALPDCLTALRDGRADALKSRRPQL